MLHCQKHLFDLDADVHYINGAYMSPISRAVVAAGLAAVVRKSKPYNVSSDDFFTEVAHLKTLFAKIVHAKEPNRVSIIPSVSYGIASVAKNLKAQKG